MDIITVLVGATTILYGVYTLIARINTPEKCTNLYTMKAYLGDGFGTLMHSIVYSVGPIGLGAYVIYAGVNGVSMMQL